MTVYYYRDIDKSDEIKTIMYIFIIAMSWKAYDNIIISYDMTIKCKMSKSLPGKSVTVVLFT